MNVTLPWPPSYNRYWRNGRNGGFISKEGRAFKAIAVEALRNQRHLCQVLEGDVCVTLTLFRPIRAGDIDNRAKVILDSLQGFCFADDKQIIELHMYRFDDKVNPRVEIVVEAVQPKAPPIIAQPPKVSPEPRSAPKTPKKTNEEVMSDG